MEKLLNEVERHIGETVIIFTKSGGISGSGITGVLISTGVDFIRILVCISKVPPYNLSCNSFHNNLYKALGAITIIPLNSIVAFTYNII